MGTVGLHRHMAQMEDFLFPSGQKLNVLWGQANDSSTHTVQFHNKHEMTALPLCIYPVFA